MGNSAAASKSDALLVFQDHICHATAEGSSEVAGL